MVITQQTHLAFPWMQKNVVSTLPLPQTMLRVAISPSRAFALCLASSLALASVAQWCCWQTYSVTNNGIRLQAPNTDSDQGNAPCMQIVGTFADSDQDNGTTMMADCRHLC